MPVRAPVFIVDDRHDVLELNRVLLQIEGYEVEAYTYAEITPRRLQQHPPGVMLLDLVPGHEAPLELLRHLRRDPTTQQIGVVVTSDSPALLDRVIADKSLGVSVGLAMPFDIEALYAAIDTAADNGAAAMPATLPVPLPLLQRAAATLRHARTRVLMRWVQRLSTLESYRDRPDLSLAEVQGQGTALLDGVVEALDLRTTTRAAAAVTVSLNVDAAHRHAHLRRAQGVSPGDLAREVAALRQEIWRELQGIEDGSPSATHADPAGAPAHAPGPGDLWELLRRVGLALDEVLTAMLDGWEERSEP